MYTIEMRRKFHVRQGLRSQVWRDGGRSPITTFAVTLCVAFAFSDNQLDSAERFVDTDTVEDLLDHYATHLSSTVWTELFDRRPTFEFVTRWLHEQLEPHIPQLAYVSLSNDTILVTTTYTSTGAGACCTETRWHVSDDA